MLEAIFGKAVESISYIILLKIVLNWLTAHPGFFLIMLSVLVWVYMAWRHRKESNEFTFSLRSVNQVVTIVFTLGLFFGGWANVFGWIDLTGSNQVKVEYRERAAESNSNGGSQPDPYGHLP